MVRVFQQLVVMTAFFARLNEAEDKSSFVPDLAHKIEPDGVVRAMSPAVTRTLVSSQTQTIVAKTMIAVMTSY
uniref:Uncharacterized protein n=2 Tax=Timema shepardi TaxID=629360 RepID=A0A7R9B9Z7_TIMSH|nr:unnamed protein product [Timema shepardi]